MKRRYLSVLLSITLLLLWSPQHSFANADSAKTPDADAKQADEIKEIMDDMTIEEKVGQLFIIHAYGKTPTDEEYKDINLENNRGGKNFKEIIENYHIGGVIYFNWSDNIGTPLDAGQVNRLSNGLQKIAAEQDHAIPLFISTDQEGGIVQRVTSPGTVFPGNMALGATGSEEYASKSASILGNELQSLGINTDFAPSLDVNMNAENPVIGVRSYSEDPELVSKLGIAQIQGFQDQHIIASAKHFLGHGDTDTDSHTGLPVIDHDLKTLQEVDLKPFQDAIDEGIDSIMTAHIVVPALDESGLPATLSKPILTDLLREDMGYDGLIITDSLGMAGVNEYYSPDQVPVEAVKAGVDVLLNPPDVEEAYNGLLDAVQSGEIKEARLDESVYRILSAKMEKGLFHDPYTDPEEIENIGTDAHLQIADDIAEKSVTLVQNKDDVLPLETESSESVFITGPKQAQPEQLADYLTEKGMDASSLATETSPTENQIERAVEQAKSADKVIVTTYTANTNDDQQQLVKQLEKIDVPVIVAALGNPYDLQAFPDVDAYINTYSYLDVSVQALANVISGDINPFGTLPVTIPDSYERGHGLDYIDTPRTADGMKSLVSDLAASGDIPDTIVHDLTLHLTAVSHYEQKEAVKKVVKHMQGFKAMLDAQKENDTISHKAYSYLETETEKLIMDWEGKQ
ncbi:glycoside hydrolase family 3 protein [Lentibacillus sp. L22]|uniref:glycoside hydrolase family 3 protein n=1 Tax=Lentibacillus sp. L22 TaxID=3163028 RepID=UPI003465956C